MLQNGEGVSWACAEATEARCKGSENKTEELWTYIGSHGLWAVFDERRQHL